MRIRNRLAAGIEADDIAHPRRLAVAGEGEGGRRGRHRHGVFVLIVESDARVEIGRGRIGGGLDHRPGHARLQRPLIGHAADELGHHHPNRIPCRDVERAEGIVGVEPAAPHARVGGVAKSLRKQHRVGHGGIFGIQAGHPEKGRGMIVGRGSGRPDKIVDPLDPVRIGRQSEKFQAHHPRGDELGLDAVAVGHGIIDVMLEIVVRLVESGCGGQIPRPASQQLLFRVPARTGIAGPRGKIGKGQIPAAMVG